MTSYEPIVITTANGSTIELSRSGNTVTAHVTPSNNIGGGTPSIIPSDFVPVGTTIITLINRPYNPADPPSTNSYEVIIDTLGVYGVINGLQLVPQTAPPFLPFTAQWLAVPPASSVGDDTPRIWLYNKLTSTPGLANLVGGLDSPRVFAKKSMTSAIEEHPYIVYKLGYSANEDLSEESTEGRQFVQIFVHDWSDGDSGDYMRIDDIISEMKKALRLEDSAYHGVIACRYLETSQDLNDETLNTVFKYVRFQLITKEK